jgi:tetratricopeptide (TPR) repeat protein
MDPLSTGLGALPLAKDAYVALRRRDEYQNALRRMREAVDRADSIPPSAKTAAKARLDYILVDPSIDSAIGRYLTQGAPDALSEFRTRFAQLLEIPEADAAGALVHVVSSALELERHHIKRTDLDAAHLDSLVLGHKVDAARHQIVDDVRATVDLALDTSRSRRLSIAALSVQDTDPFDIGVTRSEIAERATSPALRPPYVRRSWIDDQVDRLLTAASRPRTIVFHGPSKCGKSRTMFELALRHCPTWTLLVPSPYAGADSLLAARAEVDRNVSVVLWLDDLGLFLGGENGLTRAAVDELRQLVPSLLVLASVRDHVLSDLDRQPSRSIDLLDGAVRVPVTSQLSEQERQLARGLYPTEDITSGLAEHFVAAAELQRRYSTASPAGNALLSAAIDWQRATQGLPVPVTALQSLFADCDFDLPRGQRTEEAFQSAMQWAAEPVSRAIAPLMAPDREARFWHVFDYLVALDDGEIAGSTHRPRAISESTWGRLFTVASPRIAIRMARTGFARGATKPSEQMLRSLLSDRDSEVSAGAAYALGHGLSETNVDGAFEAWMIAMRSDSSEVAVAAARAAGRLASTHDDLDTAARFLSLGVESGDPDSAALCMIELGDVYYANGELQAASEAYSAALRDTNPDIQCTAHMRLGDAAEQDREIERAETEFRRALELDTPRSAYAALRLASIMSSYGHFDRSRGEVEEAYEEHSLERQALLESAAEADEATVAIEACKILAEMCDLAEDEAGAVRWRERSAARGDAADAFLFEITRDMPEDI